MLAAHERGGWFTEYPGRQLPAEAGAATELSVTYRIAAGCHGGVSDGPHPLFGLDTGTEPVQGLTIPNEQDTPPDKTEYQPND